MSKKSLICTLGGALLLGAMVHLGMNLKQNNAERDLFLANVEALTVGESSSPYECYLLTSYSEGGDILVCTPEGNCKRERDFMGLHDKEPCAQLVK